MANGHLSAELPQLQSITFSSGGGILDSPSILGALTSRLLLSAHNEQKITDWNGERMTFRLIVYPHTGS